VRVLDRLGISREVDSKSQRVIGVLNAEYVAKGEAEVAVQLANEILPYKACDLCPSHRNSGPRLRFVGGISANAKEPGEAKALLEFLTGPIAAPTIRGKGYEPG
jgi:molybdate transport system substrate-binding protein